MKTLWRGLIAVVVLLLACGAVFYQRPVWVSFQEAHLGLACITTKLSRR
jgi:hypothetical protein